MAIVSPEDIANDIFDKLTYIGNVAALKSSAADERATQAVNTAQSAAPEKPVPTNFSFQPSVVEPQVLIPYEAATMDEKMYMELYQSLMDQAVDYADRFFLTYFPNDTAHLAQVDAWLQSALQGGIGIDKNIERQLYQRDKDRVEAEYNKSVSEAEHVWAARGFGMPPGVLVGMQFNLRQMADAKQAEASRAIVVEQMKIRIENARFAVKTVVDKRAAAIQMSVEYLKSLLSGYSSANQFVALQNDGQQKLISAAADFYRSRIAMEELTFKASAVDAEYVDKAAQRYQEQFIPFTKLATDAMLESARGYATQASAALNALHTGASMNLGVSV